MNKRLTVKTVDGALKLFDSSGNEVDGVTYIEATQGVDEAGCGLAYVGVDLIADVKYEKDDKEELLGRKAQEFAKAVSEAGCTAKEFAYVISKAFN